MANLTGFELFLRHFSWDGHWRCICWL